VALHFKFPEGKAEADDVDRVARVLRAHGIALDVDGARYVPTSVYAWRGMGPCKSVSEGQRPYSDLLRAANSLERSERRYTRAEVEAAIERRIEALPDTLAVEDYQRIRDVLDHLGPVAVKC
jgi:hypothetical protein